MRRNLSALALFCTLAACNGSSNTAPLLGPVVLSPASATLGCPPTGAVFTASQAGYSGTFSAVSADTTTEVVNPGPGTNQFTVGRVNFSTSTPVNITVTGGGNQTAVFTVNNVGCICMRHHDMWNAHLRPLHPAPRR